jgi:hypothetical protein
VSVSVSIPARIEVGFGRNGDERGNVDYQASGQQKGLKPNLQPALPMKTAATLHMLDRA